MVAKTKIKGKLVKNNKSLQFPLLIFSKQKIAIKYPKNCPTEKTPLTKTIALPLYWVWTYSARTVGMIGTTNPSIKPTIPKNK